MVSFWRRGFNVATLILISYFHSIDYLDLAVNNLVGTVPSQIGTMTALSKSGVVWLLAVFAWMFYSHGHLFASTMFHSTAWLGLNNNDLMGSIPTEIGFLTKLSEYRCCFITTCRPCQ